jgi:Flp pilus assembly protein TadG
MMKTGKRPRARHGQALVEFALILPLLMLVLVGIIELGRAWNMKQQLTDAAREGARLAVVADPSLSTSALTSTAVLKHVDSMLARAGMDSTKDRVTFPDGLKTGTGNTTSVRIAYPFSFRILQRLANLIQLDSLRTTARMRNE